jgi:hypothetical protein
MVPISSSATKQLADYGGSPACMSAAQACLLFGPSRRLSMYAAIDRRGLSNGLPSGFMELPFACLRRRSKRRATGNAPNAYEPSVPKQGLPLSDGGRLGARGLISGRFSAIKDSGVGTEKGRLGILQSPEGSYGAERAAIPWPN